MDKTLVKILIVAVCLGLCCASAMANTMVTIDSVKDSKGGRNIPKMPGIQKFSGIPGESTLQKMDSFSLPSKHFDPIGQVSWSHQNSYIPSPVQGEPGSPQGAESEQSVGCCQKVEWVNGQFLAYNCTTGGDCYCDTITGVCDCDPVQTIPIWNVSEYLKSLK